MARNLDQWRTYPLEGNHDFGTVINSQNFDEIDPILPYLANYFQKYIDADALAEFEKNGFYTTKFSTTDGTKYENVNIIAINTEACYNANYYLISNREDPGDQLKWLEEKLTKMEANGEIAILIGHHPPASESSLY
jgi:3',5'-cyclic AMP phosphodiesterase CpdA